MRKRTFGDSGLVSSVIGYGGWPMGRGQYGDFDDDEAVGAARRSFDKGVTLFDTAAIYGWGYGERLMGKAVAPFRDNIVLVTKGGREWQRDNPDRSTATVSNSDRESLLRSIDESLDRLQTDRIDLFLIHWPDHTRPFEEPMRALEDAKSQGKVLHSGVSNFSPDMMSACRDFSPIVTNQIGYHIFDRRPEAEVMPFVADNGMGVMAYGTLAHGLLTGAWSAEQAFGDTDWRANGANFGLASFGPDNLARNIAIVDKLKAVASDYGKTVAQLAIAWVLANTTVTVALCGMVRDSEVDENVEGDWEMPAEVKQHIDDLVMSEGAGVGTPGMAIAT